MIPLEIQYFAKLRHPVLAAALKLLAVCKNSLIRTGRNLIMGAPKNICAQQYRER
jgi:hypothetical protein